MDFGKIFISLETGSKLRFVNRFAAAQHLQKKLANHPFCEHVQMALRQAKTLVRASLQTAGQGPVAISAAQIQDCRDVVGMQEFKAQCQRAGVPENWLHIGHLPGRDSTVGFSFTWCSSTHSHPVLAKDVQLLLTCHDFMRTFFEKRILPKNQTLCTALPSAASSKARQGHLRQCPQSCCPGYCLCTAIGRGRSWHPEKLHG